MDPSRKRPRDDGGGHASAKTAGLDAEHRAAGRATDPAGLRCVQPYVHSYTASAKRRWIGQTLANFYSQEFGALDRGYVEAAIAAGAITVNGRATTPDTAIKDGHVLQRFLHHHEPRVPGTPLHVITRTPTMVVVSKPAGVPVHASGPYRYNTLLSLLVAEHGLPYGELNPVHRLDRLTSGLVLLARSKPAAAALGKAMMGRTLRKRYLAEVEGEFPVHPGRLEARTHGAVGYPSSAFSPSSSSSCSSSGVSPSIATEREVLGAIVQLIRTGGAARVPEDHPLAPPTASSSRSSADLAAGFEARPEAAAAAAAVGRDSTDCPWPYLADLSSETKDGDANGSCPFLRVFVPSALAAAALACGDADGGEESPPLHPPSTGAADPSPSSALAPLAPAPVSFEASVAWTCGGWLRVETGIGGMDIKNCVAGVTPVVAAPSPSASAEPGADTCTRSSSSTASSALAAAPSTAASAPVMLPEGSKQSVTLFRRLAVLRQNDPRTGGVRVSSLVEVAPQTGRTHQIRVHAAWLGHAVVDDPLYCPRARGDMARFDALAAAVSRGHGSKEDGSGASGSNVPSSAPASSASSSVSSSSLPLPPSQPSSQREADEQALAGMCEEFRDWLQGREDAAHTASRPADTPSDGDGGAAAASDGHAAATASPVARFKAGRPAGVHRDGGGPATPSPPPLEQLLRLCAYCTCGPAAEFNAQQLACRGLHLHSLAYTGPGWAFACPPPAWATPYLPL